MISLSIRIGNYKVQLDNKSNQNYSTFATFTVQKATALPSSNYGSPSKQFQTYKSIVELQGPYWSCGLYGW